MISRILAAVLGCAACAWADPVSLPTNEPATQPVDVASATPTTAPTTLPKFPTPAELVAKLKQLKQQRASLTRVAHFDLSDAIAEKPPGFSFFGTDGRPTLRQIIDRMHQARDDKDIRAVLLTLGAELDMNLAQAQEVRDALLDLRRAGKKTFVYADSYDTIGYTVASGATNVCLLEGGQIILPGVTLETMFYKGTLDKIGVQADYVQIGEYKGADEAYTRTSPSDELHGELTRLTTALYEQIIDGISLSRNISTQTVRQMIDDTFISGPVAKERGFVDHLLDQDGLRALIKDELANDIDLVRDYGRAKRREVDFSNPFALLAILARRPDPTDKPTIALIYAEGVISDGSAEDTLLGESQVGSQTLRRALRTAARDENVKAVVIRIDSPGGSALASEVIWQAARRVSQQHHKPVIVSIGSMAASGGYYLACAGDYIFADRCSIVGSIGVVGGKFVLKDLYEKLGLSTAQFAQGRNADLFSSSQKWSDRQRRLVRTWMQQTYDQFTQRVMATRQGKIQDIDNVARGRVFLAQQAMQLGLVDELGGCEAAIAHAAKLVKLEKGGYDVMVLPAPMTLADLIRGRDDDDAAAPIRPEIRLPADSPLLALPRSARKLVARQLQMLRLLEDRPIALMSPFAVTVK